MSQTQVAKRVFLSSTAKDLVRHRSKVDEAIEQLGSQTIRMEAFGARPRAPVSECVALAASADALVVVVAHRYGWIPSVEEGGDGKRSITWLEVEAARAAKVPVPIFAFVVDDTAPWNEGREQDRLIDRAVLADPAQAQQVLIAISGLQDFKAWLSSELGAIRSSFTTPEDLAMKVGASLARDWLQQHNRTSGVAHASRRFVRISTVPRAAAPAFVGRIDCFEAIEKALLLRGEVVLCGSPGVGKSRLMVEYARRNHTAYPGGMFFVRFEDGTPPHDLVKLLASFEAPSYENEPIEDQCRRALQLIAAASSELGPALVMFDAVPDYATLQRWLPPDGAPLNILATTTFVGDAGGVATVSVGLLLDDDAAALAETILGNKLETTAVRQQVIQRACGVAVALCACACAVAPALKQGRQAKVETLLDTKTVSSFQMAWKLLPDRTRLLLKVACTYDSRRPPVALVRNALMANGWGAEDVDREVDAARERGMASGLGDELEIHQLVTDFVRNIEGTSCASIRPALWNEFCRVAGEFASSPGDLQLRVQLLAHDTSLSAWGDVAGSDNIVGRALLAAGQFRDAQPWLERAVSEAERVDAHGRIDHVSLGLSAYRVGDSLRNRDDFSGALPWYERAVKEQERAREQAQGDLYDSLGLSIARVGQCFMRLGKHVEAEPWLERAKAHYEHGSPYGHVDHESLGFTLHLIGSNVLAAGKPDDALSWLKRAVTEREMGDLQQRIHHLTLGRSLHMTGICLVELDQHAEAQRWFERAVLAREQGDPRGRIDHSEVGFSVHMVGLCLVDLGQYAAAQLWFERAVKEHEQGDIYSRVDHQKVGHSVHRVGDCLVRQGKFAEAQPWFERAVKDKERGDVHGRVDHASLGVSVRQVGDCLSREGRLADALQWFERAEQLGFRYSPDDR